MEGDPKKTKQGNSNSKNDHFYCKAQPDNYDRRSIDERDLGGTYQNYGFFKR